MMLSPIQVRLKLSNFYSLPISDSDGIHLTLYLLGIFLVSLLEYPLV